MFRHVPRHMMHIVGNRESDISLQMKDSTFPIVIIRQTATETASTPMANSHPLRPQARNKAVARYANAVNKVTAKSAAEFTAAARDAALAHADDVAKQYSIVSKKLAAMSVKIFAATLRKRGTQIPKPGTRIKGPEIDRIAAEMSALKSAAMDALLRNFRCIGPLPKPAPNAAKHWPIDSRPPHDDPSSNRTDTRDRWDYGNNRPADRGPNADHGDERADGADD